MKFIPNILIFVILFSLAACSNNLPGKNNTDGNIEGTWNLVFLESESTVNIDDTEFDLTFVQGIKIEGSNFDFTTTYNDDNTLISGVSMISISRLLSMGKLAQLQKALMKKTLWQNIH